MNKKFVVLGLLLCLCGCSSNAQTKENETIVTSVTKETIVLNGVEATCESSNVQIDKTTVTITAGGTYTLQGNLENGQIIVDTNKEEVTLILDNVMIENTTSAPIWIKKASTVEIQTTKDSTNGLINQTGFEETDDKVDGVIFCKSDLVLSGQGTLSINSASHGIVAKDTLKVTGGTYSVIATKKGIDVNDDIDISDGSFEITSGKDALKCENDKDETLGNITIHNGTFTIDAGQDGITSSNTLTIEDGVFKVKTGEGAESVEMKQDNGPNGGQMFSPWGSTSANSDDEDISQKALKADKKVLIKGGTFEIDSADDAFHSNDIVEVENGKFTIKTGDDGFHADNTLNVKNGQYDIPLCYEGFEAMNVTVDDGTLNLTCNDDGFNATGTSPSITINGGTYTLVCGGDCMDSNGTLTINGGTLDLTCNGGNKGDHALDCDGTWSWNGGDITTNDGSEENPNAMPTPGGNQMGGKPGMNMQPPTNNGDFSDQQMPSWNDGEMPTWNDGEMPSWGDGNMPAWGDGDTTTMPTGKMPSGEMPSGEMPSGDSQGQRPNGFGGNKPNH